MEKFYAGIGSRKAPPDVLQHMHRIAAQLAPGYTLRSGGAEGADTAFELGANVGGGKKEIYIPWQGFNGSTSELFQGSQEALELAATLHPAWERLTQGPRKMHSRNCFQVLGLKLYEPVDFVLCWTPDGCESQKTRRSTTGGTATAIVLAEKNDIPVFNLMNIESRARLVRFMAGLNLDVSWIDTELKQSALF